MAITAVALGRVSRRTSQAGDRIVFNATTGALIYDADGRGAGAALAFAFLRPNLALTNADFVVV